jgi:hypothetical protein
MRRNLHVWLALCVTDYNGEASASLLVPSMQVMSRTVLYMRIRWLTNGSASRIASG